MLVLIFLFSVLIFIKMLVIFTNSFPVAQLVEHGVSNAKIMGSIPRESKSF